MITDKDKVVDRLLGKCECETMEDGCGAIHPDDNHFMCSRDVNHKGKHFACALTHKICEWS